MYDNVRVVNQDWGNNRPSEAGQSQAPMVTSGPRRPDVDPQKKRQNENQIIRKIVGKRAAPGVFLGMEDGPNSDSLVDGSIEQVRHQRLGVYRVANQPVDDEFPAFGRLQVKLEALQHPVDATLFPFSELYSGQAAPGDRQYEATKAEVERIRLGRPPTAPPTTRGGRVALAVMNEVRQSAAIAQDATELLKQMKATGQIPTELEPGGDRLNRLLKSYERRKVFHLAGDMLFDPAGQLGSNQKKISPEVILDFLDSYSQDNELGAHDALATDSTSALVERLSPEPGARQSLVLVDDDNLNQSIARIFDLYPLPADKAKSLGLLLQKQPLKLRDELLDLAVYLQQAETGWRRLERIVLWGEVCGLAVEGPEHGKIDLSTIKALCDLFPKAASGVRHIAVLGCSSSQAFALDPYRALFPKLETIAGQTGSSQGRDKQLEDWVKRTSETSQISLAAAKQAVQEKEAIYQDIFSGFEVGDAQNGPLATYLDDLKVLLQFPEIGKAEQTRLAMRKDMVERLLHYRTIRHRFMDTYGEYIRTTLKSLHESLYHNWDLLSPDERGRYAGVDPEKYSVEMEPTFRVLPFQRLHRRDVPNEIANIRGQITRAQLRADTEGMPVDLQPAREVVRLLEEGLWKLSPALIPADWIPSP